ncbi:MAG: sulfotransferase [Paludibacter sp.]
MTIAKFQPVFIIGAARSGTKILRDTISIHPEVDCIPYDINYIWRIGSESIKHDALIPGQISTAAKLRLKENLSAYSRGAQYLIEKSVSNCLRVPFVDNLYPEAKYIFLYRDGRDVVESVLRQWVAPTDWKYIFEKVRTYPLLEAPTYALSYAIALARKFMSRSDTKKATWGPRYPGIDHDVATKNLIEVCAIQWARCVEMSIDSANNIQPDRKITVKYEDFVNSPSVQLDKIAEFLKLSNQVYRNTELSKHIYSDNIGKGWNRLTEEQRKLAIPLMDSTMKKIGYDI